MLTRIFIADLISRYEFLLVVIGEVNVLAFQCFQVVVKAEDADFKASDDLLAGLLVQSGLLPLVLLAVRLAAVQGVGCESLRGQILVSLVVGIRLRSV